MLKYVSALALATASLGIASPAAAQYAGGGLHAGELEVPVNKSQVVSTDQTIGKALIGNPDIADIVPISDRSVYVLGKDFGTTSLTLYDRSNRVIAVMDVSVGPDVMSLRNQLRDMIPSSQIDASLSNGNIVLSGLVGNAGEADRAMRIAEAFAGERVINLMGVGSSQQVMLEVKFAEVTRNLGEDLGVSGFGFSRDGDFGAAIGEGAGTEQDAGVFRLDQITGAFGVFGALFNIGNVDIDAFLDVLERQGLSKTLAEPTLVSLSGEKASFLAGGEFPIPVIQGSGGGGEGNNAITVEFKPFGVSLGFTPTVLGDGVINMIVEPEVSSIDPSASVSINGLNVPGLQTRRASTTIELRDGESFAIAGLLREEFTTTVRQVPILGSIPIIGTLFRSTSFQKGETELLIIVTPRLVNPIRPEQVRLPTDRVRDPQVVDTLLNGDNYQPQELPPAGAATTTATDTETGYEY
ncbi:type II and III secretion system protein family protein [Alteriqipengyuania sp. WL0013]|uniref:type II and III secretion system protein family protein n=1 Tax=Alteriqipengyuania sp. WL0013 TaxID=3110773 RepID=UPI002D007B71|nr:type II and III secretion system protein family protein [Alteriqipengyuania sp. WL0013]MEB3416410.1 type II and III secretion system protein family protein [Alteriqipengyuania sp. WL0013]